METFSSNFPFPNKFPSLNSKEFDDDVIDSVSENISNEPIKNSVKLPPMLNFNLFCFDKHSKLSEQNDKAPNLPLLNQNCSNKFQHSTQIPFHFESFDNKLKRSLTAINPSARRNSQYNDSSILHSEADLTSNQSSTPCTLR